MKTTLTHQRWRFCLLAVVASVTPWLQAQHVLSKPSRGGGLDTNAPMIHADIAFDSVAKKLTATLDTTQGVPRLVPLPPGHAFDPRSNYCVLSDKAYNFQYAWNPGNVFTPPLGAAVWIECLSTSPGLECYDGPGNKTESPPRSYAPIFGTAGASARWSWYGRMAHNSYALRNPTTNGVSATYRIYFGDAQTGAPDAFTEYTDTTLTLTWTVEPVAVPDRVVKPSRGGGLDTNAPMIHADIAFDSVANKLIATLDTTKGVPNLAPLPGGYTFDTRSNYYVLSDKAYNFQYAWNPGNVYTPPPGAAVWIECLSASPGLECYDGPGNKMETLPRTYAPIFGTAGSSARWSWYGRMAHNSYAIRNPTTNLVSATYRIYFGDAQTGAPDAFTNYTDATLTLTWAVDSVPEPPALLCGAEGESNGTALRLLNAEEVITNSDAFIGLSPTDSGPWKSEFACCLPMIAVAATVANGGPVSGHAALGACVEVELVSLAGPAGASLAFWEPGEYQPRFRLTTGETGAAKRVCLSQGDDVPAADPYGWIKGRHLSVSHAGLYTLGLRLVDSSGNGPGGGPVHLPSEIYPLYLQAGRTLALAGRTGGSVTMSFAAEAGRAFYLERASVLGLASQWQTVAGPLAGEARIQRLTDHAATNAQGFFRLRAQVP